MRWALTAVRNPVVARYATRRLVRDAAWACAILALILSRAGNGDMAGLYVVGQAALWVVISAALISAADYFRRFNEVLSPRIADITVAREQRSDRKAG